MPVYCRHFAFKGDLCKLTAEVNKIQKGIPMKKRVGKAGIALIFGALSAIFGAVIGKSLKDSTLDITKLGKDDGHTEDNKPA